MCKRLFTSRIHTTATFRLFGWVNHRCDETNYIIICTCSLKNETRESEMLLCFYYSNINKKSGQCYIYSYIKVFCKIYHLTLQYFLFFLPFTKYTHFTALQWHRYTQTYDENNKRIFIFIGLRWRLKHTLVDSHI